MDHVDHAREVAIGARQAALIAALAYSGPIFCVAVDCGRTLNPPPGQAGCTCRHPHAETLDQMVTRLVVAAAAARAETDQLRGELRAAQEVNLDLLERLGTAQQRELDVTAEMAAMTQRMAAFLARAAAILARIEDPLDVTRASGTAHSDVLST